MSARRTRATSALVKLGVLGLLAGSVQCAQRAPAATARSAPTIATLDVQHAGLTVLGAAGGLEAPVTSARLELGGTVNTGEAGRGVLRTDDGLALRLDADTSVTTHEGRVRLTRGRAFLTSYGDEERTLELGRDVVLAVRDAALELEVDRADGVRVIAVRGEVAWRAGSAQGRVAQGEMLVAADRAAPAVRPAGVWDDWTGGAAAPQGSSSRGAVGAGRAYVQPASSLDEPDALALNDYRVRVDVEGDLALTTVSQQFFNGSERAAPVEYRVRLPEGAIVVDFASGPSNGALLRAGPGIVAEHVADGGRAALVASADGSLYARLDPLASGSAVRCELRYAQWLAHRDGRRTYTYPMGDAQSPPFVGEFAFELHTRRAHARALRGPAGSESADGGAGLRFAKSDYRPRGDVVVDLFDEQPAPNDAPSVRLWQTPAPLTLARAERYVLADVSLPMPRSEGTDVVLLLDTSAGTDASVLNTASAAVNALLRQLGPNDRVALLFGDLRGRAAEGAAGRLDRATAEHREAIVEAIARARPAGASDLVRMLADAHAALDPRRNGVVLYLGDSMPTMGALDPERVADDVLRVAPELRLYVLSLGADPHPEVLARVTRRGGRALRAADAAEAVSAAVTLAGHATRPVLRDVRVDLGPGVAHPLPAVVPRWVAGEPLQVLGEITGALPREVRVEARVEGGQVQRWRLAAGAVAVPDEGDLRRRWALERVRALDEQGASPGVLAELSVRFGLVTPQSALVLGASAGDAVGGLAGYAIGAPLLPPSRRRTRLPRLGVLDEVLPRGVRSFDDADEFPVFEDDEQGWSRHYRGEGAENPGVLNGALALAEPAARACVARARAVRPSVSGTVSVTARVDASGHVTDAELPWSELRDAGAEACIRRAVNALALPPPAMLGAAPGLASRTMRFDFEPLPRSGRGCPSSARLERASRVALWRLRIAAGAAAGPDPLSAVWNAALERCEVRVWEDRTALLDLLVRASVGPQQLAALRGVLADDAVAYLDRAVARRFGPSMLWRAYLAAQGSINWDALLRRLDDPTVSLADKIVAAEAYRRLAPTDIDLRLRLLALYERASRGPDALRVAEELRREPYADARVLALVGEYFLRAERRDAALQTFSEIAERAPYDTRARQRLGDLLLTYGAEPWAEDAYAQYATLAALRPSDPLPRVRMALAARHAGRVDEALRLLRAVGEDARGDGLASAVEALLLEQLVAASAQATNDEGALRGWVRATRGYDLARAGGVVLRWSHPEAGLTLRAMPSGDTEFQSAGEESALPVRVFAPGSALEGSRLLVRASERVAGARRVTAQVTLYVPGDGLPRLVTREVTLDAEHRVRALVVRGGALLDDPQAPPVAEQLAPLTELY